MKRLFLALGLVVLAALTAACSSTAAQPPASAGPVDPNAPVIVAQGNAFSPRDARRHGRQGVQPDARQQGQRARTTSRSTPTAAPRPSISVGEIVSSTKATQQVPALAAGSYFFRCDVHHEMTGTINAK